MIPYESIRDRLATGDLVLFSGRAWQSRLIQRATRCRWSHVAMVVRSVEWEMLCLWESTTLSGIADLVSGKARRGVQLVPMSHRVRAHDGAIAVRHLVATGLDDAFVAETLRDLRRELRGRPYERSMIELARAAAEAGNGGEEDLSSIFCSELVAEAYQRLGLLGDRPPSNHYAPADFAAPSGLELARGGLGPEVVLIA